MGFPGGPGLNSLVDFSRSRTGESPDRRREYDVENPASESERATVPVTITRHSLPPAYPRPPSRPR
jgi:hypothetical protein